MPTRPELEGQLTPAARQAVEELVEDYRDQLLLGAAESASRIGEVREIAVHDIIDSLNRRQSALFGGTSSLWQRMLGAYLLVGLVAGGTALVLAVIAQWSPDSPRVLPLRSLLLVSLGGFAWSAYLYLMLRATRRRSYGYLPWRRGSYPRSMDHGEYLVLWRDVELALRRAVAAYFGESTASAPISALLESADKLLPKEELARLRPLLSLRNRIAHSEPDSIDDREVASAVREAERLRDRLQSLAR